MNTSKTWRAAAAAAVAIALVGGGAISASAAEGDIINPQPNGSPGSFFIYDGNTGAIRDSITTTTDPATWVPAGPFVRNEGLIIAGSATDVLGEIPVPAAAVAGGYDQVYRFVAKSTELGGGTNTWRGYSQTFVAGPGGGMLTDEFQLDSKLQGNNGGIDTVFTEGGDWYVGIAFTKNNGVTPIVSMYRTIHVDAATDMWTVDPVVVEGPPPAIRIDKESELVTPELGSDDPAFNATDPAINSTSVSIAAGAAHANQTLKVGVFQEPANDVRIDLPAVLLDSAGNGTIDVAGKGLVNDVPQQIFVYRVVNVSVAKPLGDEELLGADTFALSGSTSFTSNLTAEVTASNRFELVAPANLNVDLGDVRRDKTTTPVKLGQFRVFDDRNVLNGWDVNVSAGDFVNGPATISKSALGYLGLQVGGNQTGVTMTAGKPAGSGAFGVIASAAAGSSTAEEGALFDADLTFKAPSNAVKGVYTSTVTLDLVSK